MSLFAMLAVEPATGSCCFPFFPRSGASPLSKARDKWIGRNPNAHCFALTMVLPTGYVMSYGTHGRRLLNVMPVRGRRKQNELAEFTTKAMQSSPISRNLPNLFLHSSQFTTRFSRICKATLRGSNSVLIKYSSSNLWRYQTIMIFVFFLN